MLWRKINEERLGGVGGGRSQWDGQEAPAEGLCAWRGGGGQAQGASGPRQGCLVWEIPSGPELSEGGRCREFTLRGVVFRGFGFIPCGWLEAEE